MSEIVEQTHHANEIIIERAKTQLQAGDFEEAAATVSDLLEVDTGNVKAMYILAVCQRYLSALQTL